MKVYTVMKTTLFLNLIFLSISPFLCIPQTYAAYESHTQWSLPEGAKARLGKGEINDITCTQDGALFAVASQIGIWIYDVETSEALALLTGHTGRINSIWFSPDGRTLASGSSDNTVRLWDMDTRTEIGTLEGHTDAVNSVSFSPDGRTLVSRGDDNTLRLWDVDTQAQIYTLEGYTGSVESVSFSPDGKTIASGGNDDIVRLWDVDTRTEIGTLEGHTGYVSSVSFSPDGKTIASGSHDNTVRIWGVATQTEIGVLEGHTGWVNSVAFSPDGQTIVSGGNYGDARLWSSSDVRLWDVVTKTETAILELSSNVTGVSFSPDGQTIAYKSWWGASVSVHFLDINTQRRTYGPNLGGSEHIWDVLWVVAAQVKKRADSWFRTMLEEHTDPVLSISFSPDGRTLASGSDDGTVLLWDIASVEATSLLLGGFLTAKIDPGNDVDYFSVQVEAFGQLTLWTTTTGTLDTIGTLQDSEGVTLATNADKNVNEELNFRIEQDVYPGTYYIKVQSYAQKTGDYTIYAAFTPAKDVNGDGVVDVIDLVLVAENFGSSGCNPCTGDVNGDGEVNREDIIAVLDALEAAAAAPTAVSTTESLQRWIDRAKRLNRTDARFQKGIAVLQNFLTTLRGTETVPKATALLANYPNPFNPETWIPYQLAKEADVTLRIYAIDGTLVRTLALGHQPAGMYQNRSRAASWDGRNAIGEPVASGLYFYTLTAGDFTATRKLLIRK